MVITGGRWAYTTTDPRWYDSRVGLGIFVTDRSADSMQGDRGSYVK